MTIASRLTSIFLAGALPVLAAAATTPARPPNIIFILADDMGYGDIGPFGQKKIHTPNLDVMARQGTRFTDFYPGAAVCAPTRCCLMTGMDTGHGRIRGNRGEADVERVPLDLTDVTVAEMLRRADYATAGMGKWGLGDKKDLGVAFKQGFDLWVGYNNQDLAEDYYPEKLWRDETEFTIPENKNGAKGRFSNDLFTDEALTFMNEQRARPFFLYLAYTIPHAV
jgi:arylsulfatase A-like enzyme